MDFICYAVYFYTKQTSFAFASFYALVGAVVIGSLAKFENRSSFKPWLLRIMLNLCYQKAHKHSYKNEQITDVSDNYKQELMCETSYQGDVIKAVMKKELSKVIEGSLYKIPEDYRITFTLRELAGLNVNETAELMNTTTSNVKVSLNRAKTMLRKQIEKMYSSEDIYEFNLIYCDKIVDVVMKRILKLKIDLAGITEK